MQEFTFTAWCDRGTRGIGETYVDVELTEKEAKKLVRYGTKSDVFYDGFSECERLKAIYEKVYAIAVAQMTDEIRDFGGQIEGENIDDPNWKVDDVYRCGVEFPEEFEDMLDEEE